MAEVVWHEGKSAQVYVLGYLSVQWQAHNPRLMLNEEAIPYFGDSTFHFLGAPVSLHNTSMQARESLLEKLRALL